MAKFNYQEFQQVEQLSNTMNQVSFFGLKNNRDEAIVRFAFDNLDQLEFVTVHMYLLMASIVRQIVSGKV